MKKILGFLIIFISVTAIITSCTKSKNEINVFKEQGKKDALNFKTEYEDLNTKKDEDGYLTYQTLNIDDDNLIVYLNYDEVLSFFEEGTGIIYFGRPGCPWCRNLTDTLLDFSWYNDEFIYYYNVETIRNENSTEYKKLLEILDEYLPVDTVTQSEDSKKFDDSLKRIVLPYIFFVKEGKVKAYFNGYKDKDLENNNYKQVETKFNENYELIK